MGLLGDVWGGVKNFAGGVGEATGLLRPDAQEVSPEQYAYLYEAALKDLEGAGAGTQDMRAGIQAGLMDQLAGLKDNAAGRKQNYMEDMARGFAADTQSLARAKGGTGTLQQALRPSGAMADAQSRATSRGLLDLQSQALKDLGTIQGAQSNFYNQDFSKANALAGLRTNEKAARMGQTVANADARWNAAATQRQNITNTAKEAAKMYGAKGGGVEPKVGGT